MMESKGKVHPEASTGSHCWEGKALYCHSKLFLLDCVKLLTLSILRTKICSIRFLLEDTHHVSEGWMDLKNFLGEVGFELVHL